MLCLSLKYFKLNELEDNHVLSSIKNSVVEVGVRPLKLPGIAGAFHGSQLVSNPVSPLLASRLILHRVEPIHVSDHPVFGHEPDVLCQVLEGVQLGSITLSVAFVDHLARGAT